MYKNFGVNKMKIYHLHEFENLIDSVCNHLDKEKINKIFLYLSHGDPNGPIFEYFYEDFCQGLKIPPIKDEKISNAIR